MTSVLKHANNLPALIALKVEDQVSCTKDHCVLSEQKSVGRRRVLHHQQHHKKNRSRKSTKENSIQLLSSLDDKKISNIASIKLEKKSTPAARKVFNFIDNSDDARISYWKYRSYMLTIDSTITDQELLGSFTEMDQNGDGFIQYKEFKDYFGEDLTNDAKESDLTDLFNDIDFDGDGIITTTELLSYFNRQTKFLSESEAILFVGMVSDAGNEHISLKEFLKAMQEWKL
ncbi:unnamed protein product [Didymodactylos carnosus]|uniref:EF-hand domain-containing protein n=1 Tax=Didymodactylos carnosus TaxID=1234261 RepID=A0A815BDY9_9BILA|nr:unnamed protein product [Didymodactylos carnosus]CAF1272335.1 unnamed protein product [Didymodactylos carnosus]CAF3796285.1 unnamed protein product [Didymodactylos carnosus]CAF4061524.1 unnamed protein product [Didymodactylos carnosus]